MREIILSILFIYFTSCIMAQDYEICIENTALVNQNNYEFDVCIKSTANPFELTSYQCVLTFHSKIKNGGTLSFSYIPGSAGISSTPSCGIGINTTDGVDKITFASLPGNDVIDTVNKKIGRFRLHNSNAFGPNLADIISLAWNFEGVLKTIITGPGFTNITNPINHTSGLNGLNNLIINNVTASDTVDLNGLPSKTIDGKGFFDNDPQSYWRAQPIPQWIIFDLGFEKSISLTRFSFYNFNNSRKYVYSVYISIDNTNWFEVVSSDTSDLIEYTENKFNPQNARYVKLLLISNNENNWATVWETEIWGGNDGMVPVELNSFTGNINGNNVYLNWSTSSELNNKDFEIERKSINGNFKKIGSVNGIGTSTNMNNYSYNDKNLEPGKYFYRLKQIDYNEDYSYSNIIEAEISNTVKNFELSQNYPNPFNPNTTIRFAIPNEAKVKLTIFNILGEKVVSLVDEKLVTGSHEINFDAGNLANGIYIYRLDVENQFTDVKKMTLMK